jgi:hypothetical protein
MSKNIDTLVSAEDLAKIKKKQRRKIGRRSLLVGLALLIAACKPDPFIPDPVEDRHEITGVEVAVSPIYQGETGNFVVYHVAGKDDTLYLDPDGSGPLDPQSYFVLKGDDQTHFSFENLPVGSYTAEAWFDSDGNKVVALQPLIVEDGLTNLISLVEASDTSVSEGQDVDITVNHSLYGPDTLNIDPDGAAGPLPTSTHPVDNGSSNTTVNATFDSEGSFTPEAWLDSDGIKKYGPTIIVSADLPPTLELEHQDGGSNPTYEHWNGDVKRVYIRANDDNGVPSVFIKNASGLYVPFQNNQVLTFGNDSVRMVDDPMFDDYVEITFGTGSDRSLNLEGRVEDAGGQTGSDAMLFNILEYLYSGNMSDNSVPLYKDGAAPDSRNVVTFNDTGSQNQATIVYVLADGSPLGNFAPGGSLNYPVDWAGNKAISLAFYRSTTPLETIALGNLNGENLAPIEPIIQGNVKPAGQTYIYGGEEGLPLFFDVSSNNGEEGQTNGDIDWQNNEVVLYSIRDAPVGSTFNTSTGEFYWVPGPAQGGIPSSIYIKATDEDGAIGPERTFILDIEDTM